LTLGSGASQRPRFLEHVTALGRPRLEAAVAEERRALADFSRVELTGSGVAEIALGEESAVSVSAAEGALPDVVTEVRNGVLTLGVKPGAFPAGPPVRYSVSARRVVSVASSGSGDVSVKSTLAADELELRTEGSGEIAAAVAAKTLNVKIAGSGDVDIGGTADRLSVVVLGSGNVNARGLSGGSAGASVSGSGNVELGSFEAVDAEIAGSGDVVYAGSPRVAGRVLGSGKLRSR
jgi:hypothetical protein